MLVLTRKVGEEIFIGENIKVTVTAIDRNKVRIGITAPPDVPIHREELLRAVRACAEVELVAAD